MEPIPESTFTLNPQPVSLANTLSAHQKELADIEEYWRCANYIAAAQVSFY